jgi:hypothetical protein
VGTYHHLSLRFVADHGLDENRLLRLAGMHGVKTIVHKTAMIRELTMDYLQWMDEEITAFVPYPEQAFDWQSNHIVKGALYDLFILSARGEYLKHVVNEDGERYVHPNNDVADNQMCHMLRYVYESIVTDPLYLPGPFSVLHGNALDEYWGLGNTEDDWNEKRSVMAILVEVDKREERVRRLEILGGR